MVTLFTSLPDLSVVFFSLFCLFVFVVCLVLFSLVAAAFLANKDVYNIVISIYSLKIFYAVIILSGYFLTFREARDVRAVILLC